MDRTLFKEVFSKLDLQHDMQEVFQQVYVIKIVTNRTQNLIRVHIESRHIIAFSQICAMERLLQEQYFPGQVRVVLMQSYQLSSQYTLPKLWETYLPSLLEELHSQNPVLFILLKNADVTFVADAGICLMVEDNLVNRDKVTELVYFLEQVLQERCHIEASLSVTYKESRREKFAREAEEKTKRQVESIMSRPAVGDENGDNNSGQSSNHHQDVKAEKSNEEESKPKRSYSSKKSNHPDVLFGKEVSEETVPIEELQEEMKEAIVRGQIRKLEFRDIKGDRKILSGNLSDFTDTIRFKIFMRQDQYEDCVDLLKEGMFVRMRGITTMDTYDKELVLSSVTGIMKISSFIVERMDLAQTKRVELHCHTKMSDLDAVTDISQVIQRAYQWGHKAVAITDHGVVQAFPEAYHTWEKLRDKEIARRKEQGLDAKLPSDFFKVIYGVEGYLVNDDKSIVRGDTEEDLQASFVVFDIETTGFSPVSNRIIEIGAVKIVGQEIVERYATYINPEVPIPYKIEQLTGINDSMVISAPKIQVVLPEFIDFCKGSILVAHNASFDMGFILQKCEDLGIEADLVSVDTLGLARCLLSNQAKHTLDAVAKTLQIPLVNHHRAVDDAEATAKIYLRFLEQLSQRGIRKLRELNHLVVSDQKAIRRLPYYHVIILAKNETGRVNLYKLISESHLHYYNRRPRIPKSLIQKYREGLIIGSACEAGELFRALVQGASQKVISEIVRFYDYLEIQPIGNNHFMIRDEKTESVQSDDDLKNLVKSVVKLGEQYQKPVVATCDVHFLNPEDEMYRRFIMASQKYEDADNQAPLYFRTTEEMLWEFAFLGSDKAQEVVVTSTNWVADQCEVVCPVSPHKCPPIIPDSDRELTDICYKKAHEMYGDPLPEIVEHRLQRELHSIITNGFAVMYIIAQKLVWKSVEDGYLVGSRGSVGSSFVATMAGITEVNPLSPHYYCLHCHYTEFDSPLVKEYAGMAGCDMPDRDCPVCHKPLSKDGFDIPFETFLGFKGDKEPDIDLNFSGEYQSKAHKYTEVIFGAGQTYRAGTIGTVAEKTAYGFVKGYYEERGIPKRRAEMERLAEGCTGVRRTTGQHPGGIIVLPIGEDINTFTPVQHPANDNATDIVTTHFDYHSIDHNLLKLDILGHDDPTMMRMLQDLTGVDPLSVPLDDKKVMEIFSGTAPLGATSEQIGCKLGCLGIPEFGTDFVIQMLLDTKPKSFSDLVRISGLSHGTDVWIDNAQKLIEEGKATISTAICTRDDIMTYLIHMGVDSSLSFNIMESVRKGKGLKPEMEEAMLEASVPDWYIWSCKKIKYMFPKAHAAAYVMMAWRIAYFKVYYPIAYYAAYFSIRASGFNYESMCQGEKVLMQKMEEYKARMNELSNKEQETLKDMKIAQEMYARGISFYPLDIYQAKAKLFTIINDRIMPSFSSIEGLGEKVADQIVEAVKDGPFTSKNDFRNRTKVTKTVVELMDSMGLLGTLPETDQISIFDMMMREDA